MQALVTIASAASIRLISSTTILQQCLENVRSYDDTKHRSLCGRQIIGLQDGHGDIGGQQEAPDDEKFVEQAP